MIAPVWNVVGGVRRTIELDGSMGQIWAKKIHLSDLHGRAGRVGGAASCFIGMVGQIINPELLKVFLFPYF